VIKTPATVERQGPSVDGIPEVLEEAEEAKLPPLIDYISKLDAFNLRPSPFECEDQAVTRSNKELARRTYEAALRGDLDAVREVLDPDVKWHGGDPTALGACRDREQALDFIAQAVRRGRIGELVELTEAGEKVVVIMRPPVLAGQEPALTANVTTFRAGKVVEIVHYPRVEDALAAVAAPGVT